MNIKEYLEKYQSKTFEYFSKAIKEDKLPHSIIFSGSEGTLLKESAIYIAKSFLCLNKNPLACETCSSCKKINENKSNHLLVFDATQETIKRGEIHDMLNSFEFSSVEINQKNFFYIINNAENLTGKIMNLLLKNLEEPNSNIYAILTINNEFKLLPTIRSRCRVFKFKQIPRNEIIEQAKLINVDPLDAELLSKFYNSADLIKEISQTPSYEKSKKIFLTQIYALTKDIDRCFFETIKELKKVNLNQIEARFFLQMLSAFFEEVSSYYFRKEILLTEIEEQIKKAADLPIENILNAIKYISEANNKLDFNCNISLILDNLNYSLKTK